MYAIVEISGMQYKVGIDQKIRVPQLGVEPGKTVELDRILMIVDEGNVSVGKPVIQDAKIIATVISHGKAKKVIIFKKKRRKTYQLKKGHRQPYTELRIDQMTFGQVEKKRTPRPEKKAVPAAVPKPAEEETAAKKKVAEKKSTAKVAAKSPVKKAAAKPVKEKPAADKKTAAKKTPPKKPAGKPKKES